MIVLRRARELELEAHPNVVIDVQRPVLLPHRMDLGPG
jgi:hypothetical protein